jgi:hypothetical protein
MSTSKTPQQRYHEKLTPGLADRPECIGWRAKIDKYGNASFSYTAEDGRKVSVNAARWAWIEFRGPIPVEHKVSNACGLKSCQNLDHWELKPTNHGKSLWELYEEKFTKGGPDECWPWQEKSRDKDGYGIFSFRENGRGITRRATRWAWKRLYGSIPADQFVCHTCDNPPCQNPRHWFLGHPQANVDDMVAKGRHKPGMKPGEEHIRAKLTWDVVDEIRRLHASGQWTHQVLADRYGIARRTVTHIVNNERWIR